MLVRSVVFIFQTVENSAIHRKEPERVLLHCEYLGTDKSASLLGDMGL